MKIKKKFLRPVRIGLGGPVGSGKTMLAMRLCEKLRTNYSMAVITNDIYTLEDAQFLVKMGALDNNRIVGVETGGCPHTAIREDASINISAMEKMNKKFPKLEILFLESGGDNLAATFSPELADLTIYMIDVAMGEEIPRKGGPGITKSDILIINKIDLAEYVGVSIEKMKHDTINQRPHKPFHFVNLKAQKGINEVISSLKYLGGL